MSYIPVMGLEIHCELLTDSKMFCSCKNDFGGTPNTRICPVCTGFPGTLPILNKEAVTLAAKAGFALNCSINNHSAFDRKNYFYPDLPKAYQITQFYKPLCTNGLITLNSGKDIRISQIHMEEDAGKLIHDNTGSEIDYNRCGIPLIEIVTAPDFRSIDEVIEFVENITLRLKYAGVCDSKMEQGSLRVDVNISLMNEGSDTFGTRAELKNINSLRSIRRAIEYEIRRQSELLNSGGTVIQETRRYDEDRNVTVSMRTKADAHDYRYFPEPDILPLYISDETLSAIKSTLPEMPNQRSKRYTKQFGLSDYDAALIISSKPFSDFYDEAVSQYHSYKTIANIMLVDLNYFFNSQCITIEDVKFSPLDIATLAKLYDNGEISKNAVKKILAIMLDTATNPEEIAHKQGFIMLNDTSQIEAAVTEFIVENSASVDEYKNGNEKLFGFFMGQLMRKIGKGANPALIKKTLEERLKNHE